MDFDGVVPSRKAAVKNGSAVEPLVESFLSRITFTRGDLTERFINDFLSLSLFSRVSESGPA
jgi:hypothetical protein